MFSDESDDVDSPNVEARRAQPLVVPADCCEAEGKDAVEEEEEDPEEEEEEEEGWRTGLYPRR